VTNAGQAVEVGIYVPQVAFGRDAILDRAVMADELGIHSLWFYDHFYGPGLPAMDSFEGWTLASYVLARTQRLRVGHLVLCANFRHPALLAKMATSLDVLSEGRLEIGLGSGSVELEHHQAGLPWGSAAERAERLEETLEIVTRMLTQEVTSFEGRHFRVSDLPNRPGPIQHPRPPIHVGGVGPRRTLPLVARFADVWSIPTYGLADWEASQVLLDAECERIGRDPAAIRRSHEAVLVLVPDESRVDEAREKALRRYPGAGWGVNEAGYVGTPAMVIERMAAAVDQGISTFIFFAHDRGEPRTLELLAQEVMPAFASSGNEQLTTRAPGGSTGLG
jgi:alkanesulfonate monooxygenase SsuD/methylene tetrahydromethanopterin reductase-like flavin-dependent oxidoreductase (luciferase family)